MELGRRTFLAGGAALFAAGCDRSSAPRATPTALRIVLSPAHAPRDIAALASAWSATAGRAVELRVASTTDEAVDLIQGERVEAGLLSLGDFLFCWQVLGVEPIAQAVRGDRSTYEGEIAVRADSELRDLRALDGKRVAFVDPRSLTGFLLAGKMLHDAKVRVEPVWLGTHDAALAALRDRKVDAVTTFKGRAGEQRDLRVIGATSPVPNEPLFALRKVDQATRGALRRGVMDSPGRSGLLEGVAGITGFHAANMSDYEDALKTVKAAGESVEDMLPGGWARANEHRRPIWSYAP